MLRENYTKYKMEEFISEIIKQFPILAIFLWYVTQQNKRWDRNNKDWREYLTERNGKLEKALKDIADNCKN